MTTRQFITQAFNGQTNKRSCSSVVVDSNGDVYSYGSHYPLLFRIGGKAFRNVRGYSSTTGRHIHWSRDIEAIDVHTLKDFRLVGNNESLLNQLKRGQRQYIESIKQEMGAKQRKNTQVYKWLEYRLNEAERNLKLI